MSPRFKRLWTKLALKALKSPCPKTICQASNRISTCTKMKRINLKITPLMQRLKWRSLKVKKISILKCRQKFRESTKLNKNRKK